MSANPAPGKGPLTLNNMNSMVNSTAWGLINRAKALTSKMAGTPGGSPMASTPQQPQKPGTPYVSPLRSTIGVRQTMLNRCAAASWSDGGVIAGHSIL